MLLTINSAGRVLDLFTADVPERGVTEVARELELSKSKAHTLLSSLTEVELLRRTERGRYRLGWRLLSLNRVLRDTLDFNHYARPVMEALSAHYGETVHLGTLGSGGRVVYVDRVEGRRGVRLNSSAVGSSMPAHCSAIGKTLLAHMGQEDLDAVIAAGLPALTQNTITEPDVLLTQLEEVRRVGFALDISETLSAVSCIAAPINDDGGKVVAGISMAVPSDRFRANEEAYRRSVLKAAAYVSKKLCAAAEYEPGEPTIDHDQN